jgi:hypothetical protein
LHHFHEIFNVIVAATQAGMILGSRVAGTIKPIVVRMNRKKGIALIFALVLALHGVVLCAAAVPSCPIPSAIAHHQQEKGCHEHQRHVPCEGKCSVCCESILCAPRGELTQADGRSAGERVVAFAPFCIAVLSRNLAHSGERLARVSESPPRSPVRVFLIKKTLLI